MRNSLPPEAIRGSWYLLADDATPPATALKGGAQLLAFQLDGRFKRYEIAVPGTKDGKVEKETGDYTFDGDFLILRGRNTETFRVSIEQDWLWFLEAKKKSRRLIRGELTASDFFEFDADGRREIDALPMRARVESVFFDDTDAIFNLVFSPGEGDSRRIGCFSVDPDPQNQDLWVGLIPIAQNLGDDTWEKIIRQSYIGLYRKNPTDIGRVLIEIMGPADSRSVTSR
jgi:hypothetical protein